MSLSTFDNFERMKQRGLDARRAGDFSAAKVYLLEAAQLMLELSRREAAGDLREARATAAERLLSLAKDCDIAAAKKRPANSPSAMADGETGGQKSDWLVRDRPTIKFADVAGLDEVKEEIRLKMLYPFQHPELAERFGIRGGGGVLLYGPPGTGKTMLAKATAGEIEAAFYVVSPATLLSKWVGEAEQNIKKLFDAAVEDAPSIIFIDEIEALVPARQDDGSSVMQRVVPQILQGMEGFDKKSKKPVLFMGATNVPWQLDPAVLRPGRFDEKVYIPLPDEAARRKLLEIYLDHRPLAGDVNLGRLVDRLEGFSGADIKYLCDRAATIPFLRSVASGEAGEITAAIIDDVIADTKPSVTPAAVARFVEWGGRA